MYLLTGGNSSANLSQSPHEHSNHPCCSSYCVLPSQCYSSRNDSLLVSSSLLQCLCLHYFTSKMSLSPNHTPKKNPFRPAGYHWWSPAGRKSQWSPAGRKWLDYRDDFTFLPFSPLRPVTLRNGIGKFVIIFIVIWNVITAKRIMSMFICFKKLKAEVLLP